MIKTIEGYSYLTTQNIGSGYSSTVHRGKKDSTNLDVSIKVIEMSKLQDPINHMLLQHQITVLKSLAGTNNVLHLYDVYATKNNTYLITQLMEGDLHSLLKTKKQFQYYEAVEVIRQIIEGYINIYEKGYLHRDIKPANIFYRKGEYKIGDFGFAIPARQAHQHRIYNVGSPVYMPPEALKENKFTTSCDTWAIGIIFYQLLKGLVPWRAVSQQKLYEKIMNEPLCELTLGLPQIARTFLAKLLHLDPSQRMTPEQLRTWPQKLFSVEIRSMTPVNPRTQVPKSPLGEMTLNINTIENALNSRSKSFSNNQIPSHVSGLRVNINSQPTNIASFTNNNNSKLTQNAFFLSPSLSSAQNIQPQQKYHSTKFASQKSSMIMVSPQASHTNEAVRLQFVEKPSISSEKIADNPSQAYAKSLLSYIKFIHRVLTLISHPSQVKLPDLQLSLTKFLFKQLSTIKQTFTLPTQPQPLPQWPQYLTSPTFQPTFLQPLTYLQQKYTLLHPLPENQFILQVYEEQLVDAINKITLYIREKQNYNDKTLVALDCLVSFYQQWQTRASFVEKNGRGLMWKEFLDEAKFQKIIDENPYNVVRRELFAKVISKMKTVKLIQNDNTHKIQQKTEDKENNANKYLGQLKQRPYQPPMTNFQPISIRY